MTYTNGRKDKEIVGWVPAENRVTRLSVDYLYDLVTLLQEEAEIPEGVTIKQEIEDDGKIYLTYVELKTKVLVGSRK